MCAGPSGVPSRITTACWPISIPGRERLIWPRSPTPTPSCGLRSRDTKGRSRRCRRRRLSGRRKRTARRTRRGKGGFPMTDRHQPALESQAVAHPAGMTRTRSEVVGPGHSFGSITDKITSAVLRPGLLPGWLVGFAIAFSVMMMFFFAITWLLLKGTGIWGLNIPVAWGFDIINFVWWIGIGHAGTLISAILLLFRQKWRMSISRFAEAMTIFAVMCAAVFPVFHTGRPWVAAYWLFPYPNTMGLWPQFRSPLIWDVFAVTTYATISVVFWYVGLIPDLATMRDRAQNIWVKRIYGGVALGWRGSAMHWQRYEIASLLLAGISTPLVLSVHTVVSFDFAVSVMPGWHATIFPPYFVAGAI